MNRRTFRKQQKAIRRRNAKQAFIVPIPQPTLPSANVSNIVPVPTAVTPSLSPENQRLIGELSDLAGEINRLFHRATLKMMIDGMVEGRTNPVK
jgi:hypothetical protein